MLIFMVEKEMVELETKVSGHDMFSLSKNKGRVTNEIKK